MQGGRTEGILGGVGVSQATLGRFPESASAIAEGLEVVSALFLCSLAGFLSLLLLAEIVGHSNLFATESHAFDVTGQLGGYRIVLGENYCRH